MYNDVLLGQKPKRKHGAFRAQKLPGQPVLPSRLYSIHGLGRASARRNTVTVIGTSRLTEICILRDSHAPVE